MLDFLRKGKQQEEGIQEHQFDYENQKERFESIVTSLAARGNNVNSYLSLTQQQAKLLNFKREIVAYTNHIVEGICDKVQDSIIEKEVYLLVRMMHLYTVYCPGYSNDSIFISNKKLFQKAITLRQNKLGVTKEEYATFLKKGSI